MAITISTSNRLRFIPESERELKDQTGEVVRPAAKKPATFIMAPLTLDEEEALLDKVSGEGARADHRLITQTFREHVVGWDNIVGEGGDPLAFPEGGLTDELIVGVDLGVRAEAFTYLLGKASMRGEVEVGKSA